MIPWVYEFEKQERIYLSGYDSELYVFFKRFRGDCEWI